MGSRGMGRAGRRAGVRRAARVRKREAGLREGCCVGEMGVRFRKGRRGVVCWGREGEQG